MNPDKIVINEIYNRLREMYPRAFGWDSCPLPCDSRLTYFIFLDRECTRLRLRAHMRPMSREYLIEEPTCFDRFWADVASVFEEKPPQALGLTQYSDHYVSLRRRGRMSIGYIIALGRNE
jgi:hypothetical protein